MFKAIGRWWRRRQRKLDIEILWPACKKDNDIEEAKWVFFMHCNYDSAWTRDFTQEEIIKFIQERLK